VDAASGAGGSSIRVRGPLRDLVRDGFDASVHFGLPEPSALKARLLMRTRVVTCASPAYIARHGLPRRPREIEERVAPYAKSNFGGFANSDPSVSSYHSMLSTSFGHSSP